MRNYYHVLELAFDASAEDIKHAYRRLAQKYHPDRGNESDLNKYIEINEAYQVLSDPVKREEFKEQYKLDTVYQPAIGKLKDSMINIIHNTDGGQDIGSINFVVTLRYNIQNYIKGLCAAIIEYRKEQAKFKKARAKIKKRNKLGTNIFQDAIDAEVNRLNENIKALKDEIKLSKEMLHVLENYEHDSELLLTWFDQG